MERFELLGILTANGFTFYELLAKSDLELLNLTLDIQS